MTARQAKIFRILQWSISPLLFVVACFAIHIQPESAIATARVMIEDISASPAGYAATTPVDLAGQKRNAPVDWTIRLTSFASIRAALTDLNWNTADIEAVAKNVHARIVPGSTVIELNVHESDGHRALALLEAVLAVQDNLWANPSRLQAEKLLDKLARRQNQLNLSLAEAMAQVKDEREKRSLGLESVVLRLQAALAQLDVESTRARAEVSLLEKNASGTGGEFFSGELRPEIIRIRAMIDDARTRLAAAKASRGNSHPEVAEFQARLDVLQEREKLYRNSESKRLESYMQMLNDMNTGLQASQARVIKEVLQNQASELSLHNVEARAKIETITIQLQRLMEERDRLQLFSEGLVPPLIVLDPPSLREDYSKTMKTAQYAMAAMGALFLAGSLWIVFPAGRTTS